jgi:hypothetical protein
LPPGAFLFKPTKSVKAFPDKRPQKTRKRGALWKLPQLRKSTKVAFGVFFLMISTSCLEKPPQNPLRLSHSYHSAGGEYLFLGKQIRGSRHKISFTPGETVPRAAGATAL